MNKPASSGPQVDRRNMLKATASGLAAITIATPAGTMTPRQAQASQTPLVSLTANEATTLEAVAETLCPGAIEAGVSRFVDAQFTSDHPLFMLRYLGFNGDYLEFYQDALRAIESLSQDRFGAEFGSLDSNERESLVAELLGGDPAGWSGPPPFLVYFAFRNDAVDVTFGTPEGFETLDIPYLPHILPPENWS